MKRGKIRALIDRLRTYKGEVCRFADNPIVPFTNNQAERDLRMVRMKSKVIGSFRSEQGAIDFLLLKTFTSTAAKAGIAAFDALLSMFQGQLALRTEELLGLFYYTRIISRNFWATCEWKYRKLNTCRALKLWNRNRSRTFCNLFMLDHWRVYYTIPSS